MNRTETTTWEQRKLGEAFSMTVSSNTLSRAQLNYESGCVKNIHYGDVLVKYGAIIDLENDEIPFITGGKKEDYKAQALEDGDIIFADTAEDETTGKALEIRGLGEQYLVSGLHTIVCRPLEKKAPCFLGYYLNSDSFHRQLLPIMQGIKVLSVNRSNLSKTTIQSPCSFEEQSKIGTFFLTIDRLITLHQRKPFFNEMEKQICLKKLSKQTCSVSITKNGSLFIKKGQYVR
jgi:type I restriction enzyme S subunit